MAVGSAHTLDSFRDAPTLHPLVFHELHLRCQEPPFIFKPLLKVAERRRVIKEASALIGNEGDFTFLLPGGHSLSFIFPSRLLTFYLKYKRRPFVLNGGADKKLVSSSGEGGQKQSAIFFLLPEKRAFSSDNEGFDCIV